MDYSWLSILPPIIAIVLALLTKEVISSLLIGILAGVLIYSGGNVVGAVETLFTVMGDSLGGNIFIVLFLSLLGILVTLVKKAGGSRAYGEWASKKIKGRSGSMAATGALGVLIFVDDYFNCLTVGSVMRPVTDKFRISREKLSYLIDATAAPICIIAPISSWAVSVGGTIEEAGMSMMEQMKNRQKTVTVGLCLDYVSEDGQEFYDVFDAAMVHTGAPTEGD